VHCRLGDAQTARTLLESALKVEERYYGKTHSEVGCTLVNLALAEVLSGDIRQALAHCARGVDCLRATPNEYLIAGLACAGVVSTACGDATQGKELVMQALATSEEAELGPGPVHTELREAALCFGASSPVTAWISSLGLPDPRVHRL